MAQVPLPIDGPIGEDEHLVHGHSFPMTLPSLGDIRGFKNFGGAEEGGDGERDAGAREVREVVPRRPRRATKSNPPSKAARLPHFAQAWHQVTDNNLFLILFIMDIKSNLHPPLFKIIINLEICQKETF